MLLAGRNRVLKKLIIWHCTAKERFHILNVDRFKENTNLISEERDVEDVEIDEEFCNFILPQIITNNQN